MSARVSGLGRLGGIRMDYSVTCDGTPIGVAFIAPLAGLAHADLRPCRHTPSFKPTPQMRNESSGRFVSGTRLPVTSPRNSHAHGEEDASHSSIRQEPKSPPQA